MTRGAQALLHDIGEGVLAQPGRTGLAFLAIAVGIVALSVLLAVLGGLKDRSDQIVRSLGANVFAILNRAGDPATQEHGQLTPEHTALLAANLPDCRLAGLSRSTAPVAGLDREVTVVATSPDLRPVRQWTVQGGRFLDPQDMEYRQRSAVISSALSHLGGWQPGDVITLWSTPFTVVGILAGSAGVADTDVADAGLALGEYTVFVPETLPAYWRTERIEPERSQDVIFVRTPDASQFETILSQARTLLASGDLRAGTPEWVTPQTLLRGIRKLRTTIQLTAGSIAFLCLILGGTTLTSLMVANVRERVPEIGLRRALGATAKDVTQLFLLEGCLVTFGAAVAGSLATHVILLMARPHLPVPLRLGTESLLLPVLVALIFGGLFSYWPARSAARIAPSEALRNE